MNRFINRIVKAVPIEKMTRAQRLKKLAMWVCGEREREQPVQKLACGENPGAFKDQREVSVAETG